MRKIFIALAVFAFGIMSIAYAATQGATVSEGATGQITESSAGQNVAQGGNVTIINLTATVSTDKWQGYYGNVTGTLALGYGAFSFYDFSGAAPITVFASQNQTFDFASLAATDSSNIDTDWGYNTATDNDQAVDVYTISNSIGGVTVNSTLLNGGATRITGIFSDGNTGDKENYAFGANVTNGAAFDGNNWDYQLMVPVNVTTETYYFYVEI